MNFEKSSRVNLNDFSYNKWTRIKYFLSLIKRETRDIYIEKNAEMT